MSARKNATKRGPLDDARKLGLIGLAAPTMVFVAAALVKHHFGPLSAVCNSALGQFAQAQDSHSSIGCGVDTLVLELAGVAFWGSLVVGVLAAVVLVAGLLGGPGVLGEIARGSTSAGHPSPDRVPSPRPGEQATAGATSSTAGVNSRDINRALRLGRADPGS